MAIGVGAPGFIEMDAGFIYESVLRRPNYLKDMWLF